MKSHSAMGGFFVPSPLPLSPGGADRKSLSFAMFRTELNIQACQEKITLKNPVLTMGSCFADAMGGRLKNFKFQILVNPFGTVYNPISIHNLLQLAVLKQTLPSNSFLHRDEIHFNYNLHSSFSALQKEALSQQLQTALEQTHQFLTKTDVVMLTYGTAWVYERKDTGEIVANCHKQASGLFTKRLLSQQEIAESFRSIYALLTRLRPTARIILTLSPVRHIKDTLELNSVSKAILRTACYQLSTEFSNVEYFPAYELLLDDLRDYRFYKSDMLHPSEEAEDYIWKKFTLSYFDENTLAFIKRWTDIKLRMQHKAFHLQSAAHQTFLKKIRENLLELKALVDVEKELQIIEKQIIN
jgi:hypothetical protein